MSIVVQKYGGSSVATPQKLKEVAKRVIDTRDAGHSVVVVVSAMADTTDELLSLANQVSETPERRELDMLLTTGERISMALLSMAIRDLGGNAISFTGSQAGIITNHRHVDARIIEVRRVEPCVGDGPKCWPFVVEDRVPGRIPVLTFVDHVVVERPFVAEAEAFRRSTRAFVEHLVRNVPEDLNQMCLGLMNIDFNIV